MSDDLDNCHIRCLGRFGSKRLGLPLQRIGSPFKFSRIGHTPTLRPQRRSNLRLSGTRRRHLRRFVLFRMFVEHVFQWMQIR